MVFINPVICILPVGLTNCYQQITDDITTNMSPYAIRRLTENVSQ